MKLSVLVAAASLALGTASFAHAANDTGAAVSGHDSLHAQAGTHHKKAKKKHHAKRHQAAMMHSDTATMGASPAMDAARQARMDAAYANWQRLQSGQVRR